MGCDLAAYIVIFVLLGIGLIITYHAISYIRLKSRLQELEITKFWVRVAIMAAEQIFNDSKKGNQKKEYVMAFLEGMGIKLFPGQIELLVESATYELNRLNHC